MGPALPTDGNQNLVKPTAPQWQTFLSQFHGSFFSFFLSSQFFCSSILCMAHIIFMFSFIAVVVSAWEKNLATGHVIDQTVDFQIVLMDIDTYSGI